MRGRLWERMPTLEGHEKGEEGTREAEAPNRRVLRQLEDRPEHPRDHAEVTRCSGAARRHWSEGWERAGDRP